MAPPLADRCLYRVVNMMEHESAMKSVRFQAHPQKNLFPVVVTSSTRLFRKSSESLGLVS
jgi:hypothetical protein